MAGFLSLLRAFAWLRWRSLVNLLRGAGRGRSLESQLSAWGEVAVWAVLGVVLVFGSVGVAVLAGFGAPALLGEARYLVLVLVRGGLGMLTAAVAFFAVFHAYRSGGTSAPRLLLLPVRTGRLHHLELVSAAVDPLLLSVVPALAVLGLVLSVLRPAASLPLLLATGLFLAVLATLAAGVGFAAQLVLRDRRRAGWATMAVFAAWMLLATLPTLLNLGDDDEPRDGRPDRETSVQETPANTASLAAPPAAGGADTGAASGGEAETGAAPSERPRRRHPFPVWLQFLPSESYALVLASVSAPGAGDGGEEAAGEEGAAAEPPGAGMLAASPGVAWLGVGALALQLALGYGASRFVWRRLLASPGSSSGRRGGGAVPLPRWRPPGLSPAAAAVAWSHVRSGWRSVQGKLALAAPPVTMLILTVAFRGEGVDVAGDTTGGALVALGAVAITLLSQQALVLNQLAVDGPGLSLHFLSPLPVRDLLRGKAVGNALLTAAALVPALLVASVVVSGEASPWLWPAALVTGLGAQGLMTPVAAWTSMFLPKAVDLDKLGRDGQAHQGAVLLGMLALGFLLTPALGVGALALLAWTSPFLLFVLELVVAVLSWGLALLLLGAAEAPLTRRREALVLAVADHD